MKEIATIYGDYDSNNRQFIWTLFSDGSAMSREITHHRSDPARPSKETWRESHPAGSESAILIQRMAEKSALKLEAQLDEELDVLNNDAIDAALDSGRLVEVDGLHKTMDAKASRLAEIRQHIGFLQELLAKR